MKIERERRILEGDRKREEKIEGDRMREEEIEGDKRESWR
jgi:hypothetical protein